MTLREKQSLFAQHIGWLLIVARGMGFDVTLGEAYRAPEIAAMYARDGRGISNSLHTQRLAIDLNLFKDGTYLTTSEAYTPLGEWWERQHELARWGGRFSRPDGNHFSFEHKGVR